LLTLEITSDELMLAERFAGLNEGEIDPDKINAALGRLLHRALRALIREAARSLR
jgi:hypothetical protein